MNEPTDHQSRIVRELTENETMDIYDIAMNTGVKAIEVKFIMDEMRENGYAVEFEDQHLRVPGTAQHILHQRLLSGGGHFNVEVASGNRKASSNDTNARSYI